MSLDLARTALQCLLNKPSETYFRGMVMVEVEIWLLAAFPDIQKFRAEVKVHQALALLQSAHRSRLRSARLVSTALIP